MSLAKRGSNNNLAGLPLKFKQNLHWVKISTASTIFWIYLVIFRDYGLKDRNFKHVFEIKFRETSQNFNSFSSFRQLLFLFFLCICCLIELKFCKVSQNSFANRCWKYQSSILKNKKGLVLKKYLLSRCQYQNKKALFTYPIFSEAFEFKYLNKIFEREDSKPVQKSVKRSLLRPRKPF